MSSLLPDIDPEGLLDFSVVYTDRSLNHMSKEFKKVITDISLILKDTYKAYSTAVIPGSGTYGMEAVARQFAHGKKCLILRNGWFSYRWTQIFETGQITDELHVIKGRYIEQSSQPAFAPPPIDEVVAFIKKEKPAIVFAPHVETSAGIILPPGYLSAVGHAIKSIDGLFVLDCIASGAMWVDMQASNVDILITAPQKVWSSSPCCALIAMSQRARKKIDETNSSSFACDLKKWLQIMESYEKGSHLYHTTMPTDALRALRDTMKETQLKGFNYLQKQQEHLGEKVRQLMVSKNFTSVAAEGFQSPCVVVSYTADKNIQTGQKFMEVGLQISAGIPLQCDEDPEFKTFRLGLFGLEKLLHINRTVRHLENAINKITAIN